MRPLYNSYANEAIERHNGNAGLWYDKFSDKWCMNPDSNLPILDKWTQESFDIGRGRDKVIVNPKLEWIKTLCNGPIGEPALLRDAAERMVKLLLAFGQVALPRATDPDRGACHAYEPDQGAAVRAGHL